jgi:hypothetical protein
MTTARLLVIHSYAPDRHRTAKFAKPYPPDVQKATRLYPKPAAAAKVQQLEAEHSLPSE